MIAGMLTAVREARIDGNMLAARDLLLQRGYDENRIADALDPVSYAVRITTLSVRQRLRELLLEANYRKRERTLGLRDVEAAIWNALTNGYGWTHGGHPTASSYSHGYTATACSAVRDVNDSGETVKVIVDRVSGRTAPWGINSLTDRATRPETRERNLADIRVRASAAYDLQFSLAVARRLVLPLKG